MSNSDQTRQNYEQACLKCREWFDSLPEKKRWAHIMDEYYMDQYFNLRPPAAHSSPSENNDGPQNSQTG